jgi:hypothetical protein
MNIGLIDIDKTNFPNLVLMKISSFYKNLGFNVELYNSEKQYDLCFASSVFTYTEKQKLPRNTIIGGTGYKSDNYLPDDIEHICPDYNLYNLNYSIGFLTRGCPRKCSWCVVPDKEGSIRGNSEYEEFVKHDEVVFLDNNVLACEHGLKQIEKLGKTKIKVDFNQGLDARLIDVSVVKLLSKLKWRSPLRLACDSEAMIKPIHKAVELLRWYNVTPAQYSVYTLIDDINSALERVKFLKGLKCDPFAQPFRNFETSEEPARELRRFARWVNTKQLFRSMTWEEYQDYRGDRI